MRFVAAQDEPLAEAVKRAGGDDAAIAQGRVFVGRRRAAHGDERVKKGDEVSVSPRRENLDVEILHVDADVVVIAKPAGIPTIPDHAGASHSALHAAIRQTGGGDLHPTSRLDREVSGVVVMARTKGAAERLTRAREQGTYARTYVALAVKTPEPRQGTWDAPIGRAKDPRHRMVRGKNATSALTRYRVVAECTFCLLALEPVTGRTHQLRVHAAHAGVPLLGDRVYGGPARFTLPSGKVVPFGRVALHCARVAIDGFGVFSAPVPEELASIWTALGGSPEAWDTGVQ
jgi:RluA family pseudouridine synthase